MEMKNILVERPRCIRDVLAKAVQLLRVIARGETSSVVEFSPIYVGRNTRKITQQQRNTCVRSRICNCRVCKNFSGTCTESNNDLRAAPRRIIRSTWLIVGYISQCITVSGSGA